MTKAWTYGVGQAGVDGAPAPSAVGAPEDTAIMVPA